MNRWKIIGIFLFTGLLALVLKNLYAAGVFTALKEVSAEAEIIPTPPGIEDLDFDPETGTIFLSSHDRRNWASTGAIYALDTASMEVRDLSSHLNLFEFRPHGISFLNFQGQKLLFVISHRNEKNAVLKFAFEGDTLRLLNSYSSTDFGSPNDLLAVGESNFFLSNDHGNTKPSLAKWGDFLAFPLGNVIYFDGQRTTEVIKNIAYPNGLAYFNGKLYMASLLGKYIGVYEPVGAHYQLEKVKSISVPYAPDNLSVAGSRIYVAAHPKLLRFLAHSKDEDEKSPSAVFYLDNDQVKMVYVEDGKKLSGSSTALAVPGPVPDIHIYLGSVFESKILKLTTQ
jgi:arylesterase/paraoxonase